MGRRVQLTIKIALAIFFVITTECFAQPLAKSTVNDHKCSDSLVQKTDKYGCSTMTMSLDRFTEFYVYKKALLEVRSRMEVLKLQLDTLENKSQAEIKGLKDEYAALEIYSKSLEKSLNDCTVVADKVDADNMNLRDTISRLRRRQPYLIGGSVVGMLIVVTVIKVFIVK